MLLGNLSLMRVTLPPGSEMLVNVGEAENALLRARDLTQQLLTFARGGSPVRKTAAIADIFADSASFVLRGSKTRCDLDLPDDLWPVEIDAGQMSQVINNLLINASQAMPGGGQVLVQGRNSEENPEPLPPGRYVHIEIVDQGVGIAEEQLPKIFDPYFTTKEDGRGLGLASAYSIVRRHDGLLTVKSKIGRGTTFSIYLPASKSEAKKTVPGQEARPSNFKGTGRALVMDDDAVVVRTAAALLEKLGYEVSRAADGREAIDRYSEAMRDQKRFQVVLMDLTVPGGMGGQQAIKRLRDLDPAVKAIVYSGYSNDPVLANYKDYGFVGRLSKPFRLQDLATALEEALGTSQEPPMDRDAVKLLLLIALPLVLLSLWPLVAFVTARIRYALLGGWKKVHPPYPVPEDPQPRLAVLLGQLAGKGGRLSPEETLAAWDELADLFAAAEPSVRRRISKALAENGSGLFRYARLSSVKTRRQALPADAELAYRRGVVAVVIENNGTDFRDTLTHLFSLNKSGKARGLDLERLTQELVELAEPETDSPEPVANLMTMRGLLRDAASRKY